MDSLEWLPPEPITIREAFSYPEDQDMVVAHPLLGIPPDPSETVVALLLADETESRIVAHDPDRSTWVVARSSHSTGDTGDVAAAVLQAKAVIGKFYPEASLEYPEPTKTWRPMDWLPGYPLDVWTMESWSRADRTFEATAQIGLEPIPEENVVCFSIELGQQMVWTVFDPTMKSWTAIERGPITSVLSEYRRLWQRTIDVLESYYPERDFEQLTPEPVAWSP